MELREEYLSPWRMANMTLTITLDLSPEEEEALRRSIRRRDIENIRQLLVDALEPAIEDLLQDSAPVSMKEWDVLADELIEYVAAHRPDDAPPLSDYAISREGIYEDHP
jgi:antitoxin ParD1/3/4